MTDNTLANANALIASLEGTHSNDTTQAQIVVPATVAGAEGARTIAPVSAANPGPVALYASDGTALLAHSSGALRVHLFPGFDVSAGNGNADAFSVFSSGYLGVTYGFVFNGTSWDRQRGDVTNGLDVDVTRLPALPTGANTIGAVVQGAAGADSWLTKDRDYTASALAVTATGASGAAVTLTLPAAGAGLFQYVTAIQLTLYSAAARTGAAAPWVVNTTNFPGAMAWTFTTAGAVGTAEVRDFTPGTPLRSSVANTATTIVAPVATGGIWRLMATYFTQA